MEKTSMSRHYQDSDCLDVSPVY